MTKSFQILWQLFCHNVKEKIAVAFEAVAVVCQYKVENKEPLYDILIDNVLNEMEYSDTNMEEMSLDSEDDDYDSNDDDKE